MLFAFKLLVLGLKLRNAFLEWRHLRVMAFLEFLCVPFEFYGYRFYFCQLFPAGFFDDVDDVESPSEEEEDKRDE